MIKSTKKAQAAATAYARNIFVKIFTKDDCNTPQKLNHDANFLRKQMKKEPCGSAAFSSMRMALNYAEKRKKQLTTVLGGANHVK